MIGVFNIPAITWTLTAVLLLSGTYHLHKTSKTRHRTDRVNNSLHALMNLLMAAMLWNLAPATMLAQIALLAAAALWFLIQAVARPEFKTLCTTTHGRLACAYHALTMTGAALMLAMMGQGTTAGQGTTQTMTMTMPATHHATAATTPDPATPTLDHSPALAILPATFFTAAALIFLILLLRKQLQKTTHHTRTPPPHTRTNHGLEALSAATMALMFATMS